MGQESALPPPTYSPPLLFFTLLSLHPAVTQFPSIIFVFILPKCLWVSNMIESRWNETEITKDLPMLSLRYVHCDTWTSKKRRYRCQENKKCFSYGADVWLCTSACQSAFYKIISSHYFFQFNSQQNCVPSTPVKVWQGLDRKWGVSPTNTNDLHTPLFQPHSPDTHSIII